MAARRLFLYGLLALIISGCAKGQTVTETLHVQGVPVKAGKTVVVLPFADYSNGDDLFSVHQRGTAVMEAVTDHLVAKGLNLPVQEDVFQYLVDSRIISLVPYEKDKKRSHSTLERELVANWSEVMKTAIGGFIEEEQRRLEAESASTNTASPLEAPGAHGLDSKTVRKLAKNFDAQYLVRGRIIEFDMRKEHTWDLGKLGLLPFFYGGASQMMFGIAKSEKYNTLEEMTVGGLAGALLGSRMSTPYEELVNTQTVTTSGATTVTTTENVGTSDYASLNSFVWGAVGVGTAYLARQGGDTPQAVVQLRIWVQDAESGKVVWTNRAEVKVSPASAMEDSSHDVLFKSAVNRAVTILMDDMSANVSL